MLNGDVDIRDGLMSFQPYSEYPPLHIAHNGQFQARDDWYYNFEYAVEAYRGLDNREDLYCPGEFTFDLEVGESAYVIVSLSTKDTHRRSLRTQRRHVRIRRMTSPRICSLALNAAHAIR